jgi:D-3-phosphoglycerate dehydrogenase
MAKRFKVFIPEPEWEESHSALEHLADVEVGVPHKRYTEEELQDEVRDVDALIITSQHSVTRKVLETAPRLRVVAKYGSRPGVDNVDLAAATERGVVVCYTPGANADSVAEHTIALILALLKRVYATASQLKDGQWRDLTSLGQELLGKTVGIVGFGTVGRKVAQKIIGFGVDLIVCDPYVAEMDVTAAGAKPVDLPTLMSQSDIVTIHAILNQSTVNLIGERELRLCKKNAHVVNTARGAIIDEAALLKALQEGWIAGVALDVFTEEPPKADHPLLMMDQVLATPHFASCTVDAFKKEADTAVSEVRSVLEGKTPRFVANPEVLAQLGLE